MAPASFYPQALCVHDGWHYRRVWKRWKRRHATYRFGPYAFDRTWKTWSNGEGAWDDAGSYGGGMQFLVSTWNSVGGHGRTTADIGQATPREQIFRAWLVVRRDGGWSEWGGTKTACGLR
jgi:hypothetical protein